MKSIKRTKQNYSFKNNPTQNDQYLNVHDLENEYDVINVYDEYEEETFIGGSTDYTNEEDEYDEEEIEEDDENDIENEYEYDEEVYEDDDEEFAHIDEREFAHVDEYHYEHDDIYNKENSNRHDDFYRINDLKYKKNEIDDYLSCHEEPYYTDDHNKDEEHVDYDFCFDDEDENEEIEEGNIEFEILKKSYIQEYFEKKGSFRAIFIGSTGSGKTIGFINLMRMLRHKFDAAFMFCGSDMIDAYKMIFGDTFVKSSMSEAKDIVEYLKQLKKFEKQLGTKKRPVRLFVGFDDLAVGKNMKEDFIEEIHKVFRHIKTSSASLMQSLKSVETDVRSQVEFAFIYNLNKDMNSWNIVRRSFMNEFKLQELHKLSQQIHMDPGPGWAIVVHTGKYFLFKSRYPKWWNVEAVDIKPNFFVGNQFLYLYDLLLKQNVKKKTVKPNILNPMLRNIYKSRSNHPKSKGKIRIKFK